VLYDYPAPADLHYTAIISKAIITQFFNNFGKRNIYTNVYFLTRRLVLWSCLIFFFLLSWMDVHKNYKFKKKFMEMFTEIIP
jgi:hypothetical protein